MRTQIDHGVTWETITIKLEINPIDRRDLTQEDMDRVWPGQRLPETFRKGPWKHERVNR